MERVRERSPLPDGTSQIALGLVVNGITTYGFLVVARRALGDETYGGLAVLWGLVYILGPGLFQPLEQEVARATADRASRGLGSAPVLKEAARIGAFGFAVVSVGILISWPLGLDGLLDHHPGLLAALILALATFGIAELVRGVLSGRHRFKRYGAYFAVEGISRLTMALVFVMLGVAAVGAYAAAMAGAFVMAAAVGVGRTRPFVKPGPPAPLSELRPALGLLLATSISEAFLLNVGPVALEIVGKDIGAEAPGVFLNGLIISRVPLFFFQAVKAALLPNLASLAGRGDLRAFRDMQLRLVGAVTAVALASVGAMAWLGPWLVSTLFGDQLGSRDMALLSASGGGLMIMLSLSLGLVALDHTRLAVVGFFVGVAVFPIALLTSSDAFLRVEIALVASVVSGAIVTAGLLNVEYSAHRRSGRLTAAKSVPTGEGDASQR